MSCGLALGRAVFRSGLAVVLVALSTWTLVECAPGTTAERAAETSRALVPGDITLPAQDRQAIVEEVARRFDLHEFYGWRVLRAVGLDLGKSWRDARPVLSIVAGIKAATTLTLCLLALLVAFASGLAAAIISARNPHSIRHRAFGVAAAVTLSVPLPWLGMIAIDSLAYGRPLALFPPGGLHAGRGLFLPLLVMASAPAAVIWRHASEEMSSVAGQAWVVAARARGTAETKLWWSLILRTSLPTILALLPVLLAYLLAASVIVERVFALDGVGEALAVAAAVGDAPVLVGFAAMSAGLISMASSLVDLVSCHLDPRRQVP